ncbi:hypothetical protein SLUN_00860 [Streptomyces lunaelactis]|uniref:Uncharacterized protein n=1 Tax=Streptomyces lunaelactis TaxID=1535768 RepID=A0A2R4SVX3_9ACTN|nr:hypothetical protein [Streptomyces lunaelactis]AVZ71019.1 hypothetical protein SLUN_00860 [Streptomyces lunaelactis]NUK85720.1 hypothetical protein [Streptomyces lunaelactis]
MGSLGSRVSRRHQSQERLRLHYAPAIDQLRNLDLPDLPSDPQQAAAALAAFAATLPSHLALRTVNSRDLIADWETYASRVRADTEAVERLRVKLDAQDNRRGAVHVSTPIEPAAPKEKPGDLPLAKKTADELFAYLLAEADEWEAGTADQVHGRNDPDALDYLLTHGPLRDHETKTLVTAIRLLDPDRFGPAT